MYYDYFSLKENPFNVTADPSFFYAAKAHKEALSYLRYGITERKGIMVITGEVGTGKTTLCRALLNSLEDEVKTAYILNPLFSELELLKAIADDFGVNTSGKTKLAYISALNDFLIHESARGNNVVLIIDESQNLSVRSLELIRLLSNLETEKCKLIQIILVGQPELRKRLNLYSLRQLKQRISVHYHLGSLDKDDMVLYINHRLNTALKPGSEQKAVFAETTMDQIYDFSEGRPRLVNVVCDRSLLAGFTQDTHEISGLIVRKAISELEFVE